MHSPIVYTLDLNFQGFPGTIAAYLIPHKGGAVLVETGPGSTISTLVNNLKKYGYQPTDITDVFLTHIHLDHAGASGWLANQGATIHVHPNGIPHLINPEKLLASATRIYGSHMEVLWGEFLPVHKTHLHVVEDKEIINRADLAVKVIEVPGHANHHNAYIIGDICFSGDIGGVRIHGSRYISIPMPPPEFHLEKWRESIKRLQSEKPSRIAPTHFGIYNDANWHLSELARVLDQIEQWIEKTMSSDPPIDTLRKLFVEFEQRRADKTSLGKEAIEIQQIANPSFMSADGIQRYWNKFRADSH